MWTETCAERCGHWPKMWANSNVGARRSSRRFAGRLERLMASSEGVHIVWVRSGASAACVPTGLFWPAPAIHMKRRRLCGCGNSVGARAGGESGPPRAAENCGESVRPHAASGRVALAASHFVANRSVHNSYAPRRRCYTAM